MLSENAPAYSLPATLAAVFAFSGERPSLAIMVFWLACALRAPEKIPAIEPAMPSFASPSSIDEPNDLPASWPACSGALPSSSRIAAVPPRNDGISDT
jgi:hypothetical protein